MYKRKENFRKKRLNYLDKTTYSDRASKPFSEGEVNDKISVKAYRDLYKSTYSFKADPYTAMNAASSNYDFLAPFLKTVGGHYAGEDNIDGGNVQQYTNSVTSKFLDYVDNLRMRLKLNYRYLPREGQTVTIGGQDYVIGSGLVDEMRKAIAESVSILNSTTFTQLAINNFGVETTLPMGAAEATTHTIDGEDHLIYHDLTDVIYACSIYYQTFILEAMSVMSAHNSFRLKQGTMIRNGFNREVPVLNSFFGLMNKKAFLSLLESINLSFEGEYVDKDFMEQMNLLSFMPSRRSNAMTDPILELQTRLSHPTTFKIWLLGNDGTPISTIFDDSDLKLTINVNGVATETSFWDACFQLKTMLTLEDTTLWARMRYKDVSVTETDNARYNQIKSYFDVIIHSFVLFKPKWADYRECLDTMVRTGTITWTKGFRPSITQDTDAVLFRNLIVEDIYKMVMSGDDTIVFNDKTKRWRTYSQWNMYTGVPEYDSQQGGAFITFSSKNWSASEGLTNESIPYIPVMFTPDPGDDNVFVEGVSRNGQGVSITYDVVTISNIPVLERLAPLASQNDLTMRIPSIEGSLNPDLPSSVVSTLYKTLTQIFGVCRFQIAEDTYDYSLDPDLIVVYQCEISDVTNAAITYARANAPFRGTTSDQGILGFFGMVKGK